jgi:nucleotide-binding universal stress UspA family protein
VLVLRGGDLLPLPRTQGLLVRAYPELPKVDAEGGAFDPRIVDDDLHRQEKAFQERAKELEPVLGSRPKARVAVGDTRVLEAAEEDAPEKTLAAVGSRGLGPVGRMRLGSVSTKVLRLAKGPVLVYPHAQTRRPERG